MNGLPSGSHPGISCDKRVADPASSHDGKICALDYVVARIEGQWWILYEGKRFGGTRAFAAALREAVETAREAGLQGFAARVFIEYDSGYRCHVWSYGETPCPLDGPGRIQRRRSP
jgi:hypothetical protein